MKITPIAVAVAAAMFSLTAVANEQNKESQSGQGSSMSQEHKPGTEAQSGANPELVKQAQTKLNVPADGKIGPETQKAVKEFQTSKGLNASGQLDQETISALGVSPESASAGGSSAPKANSPMTEQKPEQAPAPATTKQQ